MGRPLDRQRGQRRCAGRLGNQAESPQRSHLNHSERSAADADGAFNILKILTNDLSEGFTAADINLSFRDDEGIAT
jgi:hypothetical protein